ncbi:hypothetical protein IEQ34_006592 [Dendrobium chrysotoxum]|uniref:Uncharacterized protein n=1 Tax=Dendrobium chrysotoxum TaxID=161865 RepID=A0AAV7H5M1_DENCH|nr:hypothetical protein IEQ34_006592 [Dendrobium chrysotoxum]
MQKTWALAMSSGLRVAGGAGDGGRRWLVAVSSNCWQPAAARGGRWPAAAMAVVNGGWWQSQSEEIDLRELLAAGRVSFIAGAAGEEEEEDGDREKTLELPFLSAMARGCLVCRIRRVK